MLLRGIGIFIIAAACILYGFLLSRDYLTRIKQLQQLYKGLLLLKGEIMYKNESIEWAMKRVGEQLDNHIGELFCNVVKTFQEKNQSIGEAWRDGFLSVLTEKTKLTQKEYVILEDFGKTLGITDRETQINCILNQMNQLNIQMEELKANQNEKCRLYRTMGVMLGFFIMILFI